MAASEGSRRLDESINDPKKITWIDDTGAKQRLTYILHPFHPFQHPPSQSANFIRVFDERTVMATETGGVISRSPSGLTSAIKGVHYVLRGRFNLLTVSTQFSRGWQTKFMATSGEIIGYV